MTWGDVVDKFSRIFNELVSKILVIYYMQSHNFGPMELHISVGAHIVSILKSSSEILLRFFMSIYRYCLPAIWEVTYEY